MNPFGDREDVCRGSYTLSDPSGLEPQEEFPKGQSPPVRMAGEGRTYTVSVVTPDSSCRGRTRVGTRGVFDVSLEV